MSLFGPFFRSAHAPHHHVWPDWTRPHYSRDFESSLVRRIGRKVRVGTDCGIKSGRLVDVARDFIILRRKGRRTLIRIEAISWIRVKRKAKRSRRRKCRCRH